MGVIKQNYVKSTFSETWLEDGIVFQIVAIQVKKISVDIAKQLVKDRNYAMTDVHGNVPVLVVVNNAISVEKEAKHYYDTEQPYDNIKCIAMLMDNYLARVVGNFVFLFDKQPVPISFFNDRQKAIDWLKS